MYWHWGKGKLKFLVYIWNSQWEMFPWLLWCPTRWMFSLAAWELRATSSPHYFGYITFVTWTREQSLRMTLRQTFWSYSVHPGSIINNIPSWCNNLGTYTRHLQNLAVFCLFWLKMPKLDLTKAVAKDQLKSAWDLLQNTKQYQQKREVICRMTNLFLVDLFLSSVDISTYIDIACCFFFIGMNASLISTLLWIKVN